MRYKRSVFRMINLLGLSLALLLGTSATAYAQGSIAGTVTNADLSTPANGQVLFHGFLDNTDEEIRIESSDGAGYDAGYWYDDFQNYLTEAPGNPYAYYFYNSGVGQGYRLAKTIPNNSFQTENITLAAVTWPAQPAGLSATALSSSSMLIRWTRVADLTYHVYRRMASSNGSFFRVDNAAGLLTNPGVADSFFVDNTVDGVSSYHYLIIAQNTSGDFSVHSPYITANAASVSGPVLASIVPGNGPATGNTLVHVYGSGFDPHGATVSVGVSLLTGVTVLSPFHISGYTPAGTVGAADVSVTNTASGLTSSPLSGGFTYNANSAPVLAAIGPRSVTEGALLTFGTSATDAEGGTPVMSMTSTTLPPAAAYVDNLNGTGTFTWTPTYVASGSYTATFIAADNTNPLLADSEVVTITVNEVGNQLPVIAPMAAQTVPEGGHLSLIVTATDAEGGLPDLSTLTLPTNATFVDNNDGTGSFTFDPSPDQEGIYTVTFVATDDSAAITSLPVQVTVTHTNQLPVLAAIGPQSTTEQVTLSFAVSAADPDTDIPHLSTSTLPGGATFMDNNNGTGTFGWTPTYADSGTYRVTFYATDAVAPTAVDSEVVTITIIDGGNQLPVLAAIGSRSVYEGGSLNFVVTATDPDGTIPVLTATGVPANATFVDNTNGTGSFAFSPGFTQAGLYPVTFAASDGPLADTEIVTITVMESGNLPPVITAIPDYPVSEGDSLAIDVVATDPDGGTLTLSVSTTLSHFTFVDNHDGTGRLVYRPNFFDAGLDTARFIAVDNGTPQASSTEITAITTADVNRAPVWDATGPYGVEVGHVLTFGVTAHDSTDAIKTHRLFLTASGLPTGATFVDNGNNTGTFSFTPTLTQVGPYTVTFLATDEGTPQLSASLPVSVTVVAVNQPPVLASIGAKALNEGDTLVVTISATDPDGTIPTLLAEKMPPYATFVDNLDGTGVFTYMPNYVSSGLHSVVFKASDGIALDKEVVLIQVYEAGNQRPQFTLMPSPSLTEGETLRGIITAADPDSTPVKISLDGAATPMANFSLVDSGNGVAAFTVSPSFVQAGVWDIPVVVSDNVLADTAVMTITVIEAGNQPPILDTILDQSVKEGRTLTFNVKATDLDENYPIMTTGPRPGTATFVDNFNGIGTFSWIPGPTDSGSYNVWFFAEDRVFDGVFDSQAVKIVVTDSNYTPEISSSPVIQPTTGYEGDTLRYRVKGSDPDGGLPRLGLRASEGQIGSPLPSHMVFVDSLNGFGAMTFMPDHNQGAGNPTKYYMVFYAMDAADTTRVREMGTVTFNVNHRNFRPTMEFPQGSGPFSVAEGGTLSFSVLGYDVDGSLPTLSAENLPTNATATGRRDSLGFSFHPSYTQAGQYTVRFIVTDNVSAKDTQDVVIDVLESGNQAPVFTTQPAAAINVAVGLLSEIQVQVVDPDGDAVVISASPIVTNASFTDFGDGTATYFITPDASQLGQVYPITIIVRDPGLLADTATTTLTVVTLMRGDADANRKYTMNDVVCLIAYLFRNGPAPTPTECADVDNSGKTDVDDVAYLLNYIYKAGPRPPQ